MLRPTLPEDAEALLALYRPLVLETAISFEIEPPSVEEFRRRIEATTARWAWLVAENGSTARRVVRNVGRKFGRWHDVSWWQRRLRDEPPSEA